MSCTVVVSSRIRQQIASLSLPPDLEDDVYRRLSEDLQYGHEMTCFRVMQTYVYAVALMDTTVVARRHLFTFYLVDGDKDTLHVVQFEHRFTDNWFGDPDDGGPGSPEDV